jgi:ABC-type arginine/histidine transport system permease subunit
VTGAVRGVGDGLWEGGLALGLAGVAVAIMIWLKLGGPEYGAAQIR